MQVALIYFSSSIIYEVRKRMKTNEKQEKPLRSFILPNESFKWDFVLDLLEDEDSQGEPVNKRRNSKRSNLPA
jgi:hypothetical protein